jgi:uncharacterized protein
MKRYLIAGLVGLLGGTIGVMFGMSGAFIIIPLLILFNVCSSQLTAQGTVLCMLLPPISIFAAITYYKNKHVDIPIAIIMSLAYIIGTFFGSHIALNFSERKARMNFSVLLLILAGYIFYSSLNSKDEPIKLKI